jgi:hypothetical protein
MKQNTFFLTLFTLNLAIGTVRANQVDDSHTNMMIENTTGVSSVRANGYREVRDLQPFTHVAKIPADSDKSTIRFEGAKMVQVRTTIRYAMNGEYCKELAFRDPGGSCIVHTHKPDRLPLPIRSHILTSGRRWPQMSLHAKTSHLMCIFVSTNCLRP